VHLDHKSKNDHGHFTFLSIWQFTVRTNVRMSLNSFPFVVRTQKTLRRNEAKILTSCSLKI
jgi:hypothetical protein